MAQKDTSYLCHKAIQLVAATSVANDVHIRDETARGFFWEVVEKIAKTRKGEHKKKNHNYIFIRGTSSPSTFAEVIDEHRDLTSG